MGQSNKFVDSSRLGVTILSIFALVWAIAAMVLSTVPLTLTVPAAALVFIAAAAIITIANSRRFVAVDEQQLPMAPRQRRTIFIAANIVQAILFSVLLSVSIALDELAYILLGGSVIVGLHLIPIGLSFGEKAFIVDGSFRNLDFCERCGQLAQRVGTDRSCRDTAPSVNYGVLTFRWAGPQSRSAHRRCGSAPA